MSTSVTTLTQYAWLIPLLPLLSSLLLATVVRPWAPRCVGVIATVSVALSFFLTASIVAGSLPHAQTLSYVAGEFAWLRYAEHLTVNVGVLVDPLSLLLMLVVTSVSTLVHIYSLSYLHHDEGKGRFFTYLNLFTASMLGLVSAPNIFQMFVCWELVGASSFLLIGYYYTKPEAVAASKKAFIVTRFADLGFLLAALIFAVYGYESYQAAPQLGIQPFDFAFLSSPQFLESFAAHASFIPGVSLLTLTLVLLFVGAAGKSAMFPLHIWLPDAMEGPTPVSALIHAATMVVAGVYLVARMFPLYLASPSALSVVAGVGAFTCFFAAILGCVQHDIKRILAFSTLSQLGYMMLALGVASSAHPLGYSASMFHLFTHAFFKALLFLCAGAVIHSVHANSIWQMGALRRVMPYTHLAFLAAFLAIAGVPPFAGFWSKDEILLAALESGHYVVFAVALTVAALTAFYMGRLYLVCFWGSARSDAARHAHEVSVVMLVPLFVLALLSIGAGFFPVPALVSFGKAPEVHQGGHIVPLLGSAAAIVGLVCAWIFYGRGAEAREWVVQRMGRAYTLLLRKFYIDEIYLWITHSVLIRYVSRPAAYVDRYYVDGAMNLSGWSARRSGGLLAALQTGQLQWYGISMVVGVVILYFCL